jgi:hypothetical protein
MVALVPVDPGSGGGRQNSTRTPGHEFALAAVPGTYLIHASALWSDSLWMLRRATLNGRDVLDMPLQIGPAASLSGLVLSLSRRSAELAGVVKDGAGRPAAHADLALVSTDARHLFPGSRRVRRVTTAADGTYLVAGLPPGEYRIGAAAPALTGGAFLQVPQPAPFVVVPLSDGERRTQNLTVAR